MNIVLWTTISQMTELLKVIQGLLSSVSGRGYFWGSLTSFFFFTKLDDDDDDDDDENVNDQEN